MAVKVYIPGDAGTYRNYRAAVERAGGLPCFGIHPELCDCLLLPGGGDIEPWRYKQPNTASRNLSPADDALEWKLLESFISRKKPVLGVCRGMQVINVFFGGDLVQDWPGHSAVNGADRLHSVGTAPGILRTLYGTYSTVNSSHHQIVGRPGDALIPLQWAPDGVVEALRHRTLPIVGVQWHPERLGRCRESQTDGLLLYRCFLSGGFL